MVLGDYSVHAVEAQLGRCVLDEQDVARGFFILSWDAHGAQGLIVHGGVEGFNDQQDVLGQCIPFGNIFAGLFVSGLGVILEDLIMMVVALRKEGLILLTDLK